MAGVGRAGGAAGATTDAIMNCRAVSRNMLALATGGGGAREARRSALISAVERTGHGSRSGWRSITASVDSPAVSGPPGSIRTIVATAAVAPTKAAITI